MDADLQKKWKDLEAALAQAGVPRALWPTYFEKEEHRADRRRAQNDEERDSIMRRISARDIAERRRRERFSQFVVMLLWLLNEVEVEEQQQQEEEEGDQWQQQAQQQAQFLGFGHRSLLTTEHAQININKMQQALCGVAWAKYGRRTPALDRALQVGVGNADGSAAFPMQHALRALEQIDLEQEVKAKAKADEAKPEVQHHEQNNDVQKDEDHKQDQQQPAEAEPFDPSFDPELAAPTF